MTFFQTYSAIRLTGNAKNRPRPLHKLLLASFYLLKAALMLPIVAFQLLNGIKLTRVEPPRPHRGTSTLSGRPLRTFDESLEDLANDTRNDLP